MTPQPQTEDEETEGEGEGEEKKTADKKHAEGAFELLEQREKLTQDSFEQALTLVQVNSLSLAQRQTWMEWNVKRLAMTKECEGWS